MLQMWCGNVGVGNVGVECGVGVAQIIDDECDNDFGLGAGGCAESKQ